MPGTGHSARYKGSISNRSKISPFEHLAKWNQQLLGADGAVPSIVGGNSLEFKKLDASNIAGVMHNPAIADLNMNTFDIFNATDITLSGNLKIDGGNGLLISNTPTTGLISKFGGDIELQSANTSTFAETARIKLKAVPGAAPNNQAISLESSEVDSDIFIGHLAVSALAGDNRSITIGTDTTPYAGGETIFIGTKAIAGITNAINIGNTGTNCRINLRAGTSGSSGIQIGGGGGTRIGFLGASPALRSAYGVLGPNLPVGASLAATVTMVQNIHDALVTVGLCQQ